MELVEHLAQPPSVPPVADCPFKDNLRQAEWLLVHMVRILQQNMTNEFSSRLIKIQSLV